MPVILHVNKKKLQLLLWNKTSAGTSVVIGTRKAFLGMYPEEEEEEEEEEEILFCQTNNVTTTTQIARNHGRLPEKGFRPSKLATYCITQQNTKNTNVQLCKMNRRIDIYW